MSRLAALARRIWPPSAFVWLLLSVLFFLLGAASFNHAGSRLWAEVGVMGAVAVIAVIAAFMG